MKWKLHKWQSGRWYNVIVVVDVRYVYAPFNLLDQSQKVLHDKYRYSEETVFTEGWTPLGANELS